MIVFKLLGANHYLRSNFQVRYLVSFGNEWRGTAGPWVGLDHVHLIILDCKLNVDQAQDIEGLRQLLRDLHHLVHRLNRKAVGRQYGSRVTRVHTRRLNVLHDPHHVYFFTVEDGVYFRFLSTVEEVVNQHAVVRHMLKDVQDVAL